MVRPLEIVESDNPEGTVALHGDGVPSQPFPVVVIYFRHDVFTPPRESCLVSYKRLLNAC
jgi:hypothetical protein